MKLSFFAAALLGVTAVNAVYLQPNSVTEGEGEGETKVWTDADCEQIVNGQTVRLQIPECMPKPNTDQLIMSAVGELGAKTKELNEALMLAFARNQRLASTKTMKVGGTLTITPSIEEPALPPRTTNLNLTLGTAPTATVALAPAEPQK